MSLWSAEGLGCVVQVQAAALQVALQLLSGPTPARIPFHDLLGASMTALQSWVDFDGAFMGHPLYAKWTQRLLAVLHVLSRASWPQGIQDVARTKLTKVCGRRESCLPCYRHHGGLSILSLRILHFQRTLLWDGHHYARADCIQHLVLDLCTAHRRSDMHATARCTPRGEVLWLALLAACDGAYLQAAHTAADGRMCETYSLSGRGSAFRCCPA